MHKIYIKLKQFYFFFNNFFFIHLKINKINLSGRQATCELKHMLLQFFFLVFIVNACLRLNM